VCKLWVVDIVRESLISFERNCISSYFDKLLGANTFGVRDIIPLLQVVHGMRLTAAILRVIFFQHLYGFYMFSRLLHIPIRLIKDVVRADGLW
jgi:hypothetical protein